MYGWVFVETRDGFWGFELNPNIGGGVLEGWAVKGGIGGPDDNALLLLGRPIGNQWLGYPSCPCERLCVGPGIGSRVVVSWPEGT